MQVKGKNIQWWGGCFLIVLLFTSEASADKILMKNGDRFRGTVENVKDGVLTFSTKYSENIKIQISQIKKLLTEKPLPIHLQSGEILNGRILPAGENQMKVEASSGRGQATLSWDAVKSINLPPVTWHGSVSAGSTLITGNTERFTASIGADASRRWDNDRINLHFLTNYAEDDDEVSARNTYGDLKFSHFFSEKLYTYLVLELLSDSFKDLDLRTTVGPGAGYQVWEDAIKSLSFEGGLSYFSENRITGADTQFFTARFAADFSYKLTSFLTFTNQMVIFPSVEDLNKYTLRNRAGLDTALGNGWELKLANIWQRDSKPSPGVKNDDLQWLVSLGYAF
jgi:putative salt-induced outer membrane protein YdiY